MKILLTISVSLLFLSCAPGDDAAISNGAAAGRVSAVGGTRTDEPERREAPPADPPAAETGSVFTTGQTLYVSVYSHVYWGADQTHFNLACNLSIRNIDPRSPIVVTAVDYYNTAGAHVRNFIEQPRSLAPLETADFYIKERDTTGGSGANFIVRWDSPVAVNAPIVEAVMIGVDAGQGISFICPAREISE